MDERAMGGVVHSEGTRAEREDGNGRVPIGQAVEGSSGRRPVSASLFAAGLGVLCACLFAFALADPAPPPPGEPRVWVADRDGSRVVGLDADLYVSRTLAVDWPFDVEPAPGGGLWILRAETSSSAATHRLDRIDGAAQLVTELWIERALDLDVLGDGDQALVVEARASELPRLLRVRVEGSLFPLLERAGMTCVTGERAAAVVGGSDGSVLRVDALTGAVQVATNVGGSVVDLARGPRPGTVWVLDGAGTGRVLLLESDLSVRWSVVLPRAAIGLAPVANEERVWLSAASAPCVSRYGPGGALELDRCGLPLPGLGPALAWRNGVLVCAGGALLRLDVHGAQLPGQGGFDALLDVAPAASGP